MQFAARLRADIDAEQPDRSGGGMHRQIEKAEQRRFAGATAAGKEMKGSARQHKVGSAEDFRAVTVAQPHRRQIDDGSIGGLSGTSSRREKATHTHSTPFCVQYSFR